MRIFIFIVLFIPYIAFANLEQYKILCKEIGYKPGTENFGSCVLKLKKKNDTQNVETQQQIVNQQQNQYQQNTREQAIRKANEHFARIQAENDARQRQYQEQMLEYQRQIAKAQKAQAKERERQKNLKLIELGLGMAAGKYESRGSSYGSTYIAPPAPPPLNPYSRYRMTFPDGSYMDCDYNSNTRNANCF